MKSKDGLTVSITGQAEFKKKKFTIEKSIKFTHKEVDWVDVQIDSNNFKIDTILRVNLKDGGEKGLNSWDKVSKEALNYYNEIPVQVRTKKFEELRDEALDGISTYWTRTYDRTSQKGTIINGEKFELLVKAINMENGMKAPNIIYFTNSKETNFTRSHNYELHRELYYYAGYTYHSKWKSAPKNKIIYVTKGWIYKYEADEIEKFKETAAHEIGHQLLFEFGGGIYAGRDYSYSHKGTSGPTWIQQDALPGTTYPAKPDEIDLMKYADSTAPPDYFDRVVLSKEDSLGLIWLSKIKILGILLCCLLITSCQKNIVKKGNREIVDYYNGIVVDRNHNPLEGVKVKMSGEKTKNDVNGEVTMLTTTTDKKGYFAIKDSTIDSLHILRVQSESRKLIFEKEGFLLDSVSTRTSSSNYKPAYDAFDGSYFIFKIPDTMTLRKVQFSK